MASTPSILIADEPTSALDPTVQAQYLELLRDLQRESGLSIILITHDLGVVAAICDTIAIMYAGRIVEYGPTRQVFRQPAHPYTEGLLRSVPTIQEERDRLEAMPGQPPSPFDVLQGCTFTPRCPYAQAQCEQHYPEEVSVGPGHRASCWRIDR
jgi:oligopeptide/dipeptide ABC transporter ATP-binding protein